MSISKNPLRCHVWMYPLCLLVLITFTDGFHSIHRIAHQGSFVIVSARNKHKKAIDVDLSFLQHIDDDKERSLKDEKNFFSSSSTPSDIKLTPISSEYIDVDSITKSLKRLGINSVELEDIRKDCIPAAGEALRTHTTQRSTNVYCASSNFAICKAFGEMIDLQIDSFGGYQQAERKRIYFSKKNHDNMLKEEENKEKEEEKDETLYLNLERAHRDDFILCSLSGNFIFEKYDQDQFVSKLLQVCNIKMSELGDLIVVGERGCQFFVVPEVKEQVINALNDDIYFDSVPIKCEVVEIDKLKRRERKTKEITTVEASLRVDSLASFGFGLSRSKVTKMIEKGEVSIDYKTIKNSAQIVQVGQTITLRGKGNLHVKDSTTTSKGRYRVKMLKVQ